YACAPSASFTIVLVVATRQNADGCAMEPSLPGRIMIPSKEGPMAARAYWQGQIRLALVSIPVEVYPATRSSASIAFHQIHEPSGKRIKYEKVAPGVGPVEREDIVKGYEISKGNYVL